MQYIKRYKTSGGFCSSVRDFHLNINLYCRRLLFICISQIYFFYTENTEITDII